LMMNLVLYVFKSLMTKICGSCLLNKQTYTPTNVFAAHPNSTPQSRARSWMDTNPNEMKTLIGFLILQGIVQKPENGMYFSKTEIVVSPYFSKEMTKKIFHRFLKFLHFADNSKLDPEQYHKKLYKMQTVLDHLKPKVFLCTDARTKHFSQLVSPLLERATRLDSTHDQSKSGLK